MRAQERDEGELKTNQFEVGWGGMKGHAQSAAVTNENRAVMVQLAACRVRQPEARC